MNQISDRSKSLNSKTPITIFSLIAFVCILLSSITYFLIYIPNYVDGELTWEIIVVSPSLLGILFFLVDMVPCVLFTLYIFKFHKEYKGKIFMPIIFVTFVFEVLLIIAESIVYHFNYDMTLYIIYFAQFITFSLATLSALKGFSKKHFPIIALSVGLVTQAYNVFNFIKAITGYVEDSMYFYLFTRPMRIIGFTSLFIALLLFVLNNKTLPISNISSKTEKINVDKMNPEQALRLLNNKLNQGMITEEEYQVQRAEIISKL